jgi:hypothetical protein
MKRRRSDEMGDKSIIKEKRETGIEEDLDKLFLKENEEENNEYEGDSGRSEYSRYWKGEGEDEEGSEEGSEEESEGESEGEGEEESEGESDDIMVENDNKNMISKINEMVEIMRPLVVLYDVDEFYLPQGRGVIQKYIDTFKDLFKHHKGLFKYIFKIDKVLPINSANGRIFILKTLTKEKKSPKLLVKVALSKEVDPISYEYYVGLTLNKLRIDYNIDHFTIMYGRFHCGLDPKVDVATSSEELGNIELCNEIYSKKSHLLYEFIRDIETDKVMTLSDYIDELKDEMDTLKREINIINIMILVLNALQQSQDKLDFTHYDLHTKNILVVKLVRERVYNIEYNNNKITIITDVVPHIIDYGRSHIDPDEAVSGSGTSEFYDYELNESFSNFRDYQNRLFKKYVLNRNKNLKMVEKIEWHLHKLAYRYIYRSELTNGMAIEETFETLRFKKNALKLYYNGIYEESDTVFKIIQCDFGIDTKKSHKKYDFFRICRIVGGVMLNYSKSMNIYSKNLWKNLGDKLELQYPYHDGWYYSLTSDYQPNPIGIMTDDDAFSSPMDIVYYLYNVLYKSGDQYGGGDDDTNEKIEKESDKAIEIMKAKRDKVPIEKEKLNVANGTSIRQNNLPVSSMLDFNKMKRNLEKEKIKYDFMKIDYSDMNAGSFINK